MKILNVIKKGILPAVLTATIMIPQTNHIVYAKDAEEQDTYEVLSEESLCEDMDETKDIVSEISAGLQTFENSKNSDCSACLDNSDDSPASKSTDEFKEAEHDENKDSNEDQDISDEKDPDKELKDEEIDKQSIETTTIDICAITISYTKEVEIYDGFFPTGETEMISLKSIIEVSPGEKLSSLSLDSETEDILKAVDCLKDTVKSGYEIKAEISLDGEISIIAVNKTTIAHDSTDVTLHDILKEDKSKNESH